MIKKTVGMLVILQEKLKRCLISPGGIVTLILIIIIAVLLCVNQKQFGIDVSEYTSGAITELFGIIVTVVFVQFLFDRRDAKESKEKEATSIKRASILLQQYIERYTLLYNCVATPLECRESVPEEMKESFTLKDMLDLHETSLLVADGHSASSLENFLKIELELRNQIISIVKEIGFVHFPQLAKILLQYIEVSLKYDCRSALLDSHQLYKSSQTTRKTLRDLLENRADEFYQELLSGKKHNGNMMHPYVFLYEMMKEERSILTEFHHEVSHL